MNGLNLTHPGTAGVAHVLVVNETARKAFTLDRELRLAKGIDAPLDWSLVELLRNRNAELGLRRQHGHLTFGPQQYPAWAAALFPCWTYSWSAYWLFQD